MKTTKTNFHKNNTLYTENLFFQYRFLLFFGFLFFVFLINFLNIYGLLSHSTHPSELSKWVPWVCPFHFITDLLCPGCGLTRSFMALIQGEIKLSFHYHPLGPFIHSFLIFLLFDFTFLKGKNLQQIYFYLVNAPKLNTVVLVSIMTWTYYRNVV